MFGHILETSKLPEPPQSHPFELELELLELELLELLELDENSELDDEDLEHS
jgi:hypothetical protein